MVTSPAKKVSQILSVLQNLHERGRHKLVVGQTRQPRRLFFGYRAAIDRAQKIIQKALARRGIVEHVANQRGLRGFLDEIAQTLGSRVEALQKECVDRRVACRQLRRMQVPSLIETADQ